MSAFCEHDTEIPCSTAGCIAADGERKATSDKPTAATVHQHHLAYDPKSTGWRVDLGDVSIRIQAPQGTSGELKKAIALRLAVTWNMNDGIPTQAILDGVVGNAWIAARELCDAIERNPSLFTTELRDRVAEFRTADNLIPKDEVHCTCNKENDRGEEDEDDEAPEEA